MKKKMGIIAVVLAMTVVLSSCALSAKITADEAKTIALQEAGVTAEAAEGLTAQLERDDGRAYYEVDFYVDAVEYDVEVDAKTGEIVKYDLDNEKVTTTAAPTTTAATSFEGVVSSITATYAQDIALAEAGLKADEVKGLRATKEYDDGREYYEVEFYADGMEYDVDVDIETGEVLKFDRDKSDDVPAETPADEMEELQGLAVGADMDTGTIAHYDRDGDVVPVDDTTFDSDAAKKAKQTALADAGFTAEEVENLTIWIDYDDGKMYYDVEFFKDGTEYEYEIDRETGKIVDKDIDAAIPD